MLVIVNSVKDLTKTLKDAKNESRTSLSQHEQRSVRKRLHGAVENDAESESPQKKVDWLVVICISPFCSTT